MVLGTKQKGKGKFITPPDWNLPDTENLPSEFQPRFVYDLWQRMNPETLYMIQLKDYLNSLVMPRGPSWQYEEGGQAKPMMPEYDLNPDSPSFGELKADKFAKPAMLLRRQAEILNMAGTLIGLGRPIESLPFYKESRQTIGPLWQQEYELFVQEQQQEQQNMGILRQRAQGREYRPEVLQALSVGAITPDEAEQLYQKDLLKLRGRALGVNEGYDAATRAALEQGAITPEEANQRYRGQVREELPQYAGQMTRASERDKLIRAVNKGIITPEEAFGSTDTTQPVFEGADQPYGEIPRTLTPWETWARGENAVFNKQAGANLLKTQGPLPELAAAITQAKQYGVDTSALEGIIQSGAERGGRPAPEAYAPYLAQITNAVGSIKKQQQAQRSAFMVQEYPDWYGKFQQAIPQLYGGGTGAPEGFAPEAAFMSWANTQLGFQEARLAKETQRWTEYGDIYPAYGKYQQGFQPVYDPMTEETRTLPYTFEKWLEQDPYAVAYLRKRKQPGNAQYAPQVRRV